MFTLEAIKAAHAKVKSGADFPTYIAALRELGVQSYETHVTDGRTNYFGADGYVVASDLQYAPLEIADAPNVASFQKDLKAHQDGHTDYATFCADCAKSGIEKWILVFEAKTCTYYDRLHNAVLREQIPV